MNDIGGYLQEIVTELRVLNHRLDKLTDVHKEMVNSLDDIDRRLDDIDRTIDRVTP